MSGEGGDQFSGFKAGTGALGNASLPESEEFKALKSAAEECQTKLDELNLTEEQKALVFSASPGNVDQKVIEALQALEPLKKKLKTATKENIIALQNISEEFEDIIDNIELAMGTENARLLVRTFLDQQYDEVLDNEKDAAKVTKEDVLDTLEKLTFEQFQTLADRKFAGDFTFLKALRTRLDPEDFKNSKHRELYQAAKSIGQEGEAKEQKLAEIKGLGVDQFKTLLENPEYLLDLQLHNITTRDLDNGEKNAARNKAQIYKNAILLELEGLEVDQFKTLLENPEYLEKLQRQYDIETADFQNPTHSKAYELAAYKDFGDFDPEPEIVAQENSAATGHGTSDEFDDLIAKAQAAPPLTPTKAASPPVQAEPKGKLALAAESFYEKYKSVKSMDHNLPPPKSLSTKALSSSPGLKEARVAYKAFETALKKASQTEIERFGESTHAHKADLEAAVKARAPKLAGKMVPLKTRTNAFLEEWSKVDNDNKNTAHKMTKEALNKSTVEYAETALSGIAILDDIKSLSKKEFEAFAKDYKGKENDPLITFARERKYDKLSNALLNGNKSKTKFLATNVTKGGVSTERARSDSDTSGGSTASSLASSAGSDDGLVAPTEAAPEPTLAQKTKRFLEVWRGVPDEAKKNYKAWKQDQEANVPNQNPVGKTQYAKDYETALGLLNQIKKLKGDKLQKLVEKLKDNQVEALTEFARVESPGWSKTPFGLVSKIKKAHMRNTAKALGKKAMAPTQGGKAGLESKDGRSISRTDGL